jgi:hypothetical protein
MLPRFSYGIWEVLHSLTPLDPFKLFLGLFKEFKWETRRWVRVSVRTEAGLCRSRLEVMRMQIRLMMGTRRTGHGRLMMPAETLVAGERCRWLRWP